MTNRSTSRLGRVLVNHLGYCCHAEKCVVVADGRDGEPFEIQNMARNRPGAMGEPENFQAVLTGSLSLADGPLGRYAAGDFSALTQPGIYRVVLPESGEHSYQFMVGDGAFSLLPELFLRWIHAWRSGPFENAWRGPSHLDDGVRSDNGEAIDAVGGWYDAGDVRKWMVHSTLPALALMQAHERIPWFYSEWERADSEWSPWLHEARWGLDLIVKMQDPASGMFYEDIGGGGGGRRKPNMTWWYANHSGCYADNTDNRFTDNTSHSGDERPVRIQYNPIAQFTNTAVLARAARVYAGLEPDAGARWREAACAGWKLGLQPDPRYYETPGTDFGSWTSVRSWRCLAAVELCRIGGLGREVVEETVDAVLDNFDSDLGFWRHAAEGDDPYRAILHSAQPLLALVEALQLGVSASRERSCQTVLRGCLESYVKPLCAMTPFHFMPFGVYRSPGSDGDLYRPWRDGLLVRFFMPACHDQKIYHGLMGHWMSWAHGLASVGAFLGDAQATALAWDQLYWATGRNPYNACVISGVGYGNPMPHSRLLGTYPGGFCNGFMGTESDEPFLDIEADAQWNSTEYWTVPLCNALMALSLLNPAEVASSAKLGTAPIARAT